MPTETRQKWKRGETRYVDKDWNPDEIAAFEDGILLHGAELRAVRDEVGTRTMPEVVRFYGHWKKYEFITSKPCKCTNDIIAQGF